MNTYTPRQELTKAIIAAIAAQLPWGIGMGFKAIPYKEQAMRTTLEYMVPLSLHAIAAPRAAGTKVVLAKGGKLTKEVKESLVRRIANQFVPNEVRDVTAALYKDIFAMARDQYAEDSWKLALVEDEIVLFVTLDSLITVPSTTVVEVFLNSSNVLSVTKDRILKFFSRT